MSVYKYLDYRKVFKQLFAERRNLGARLSLAQLAKSCGIQATYLTNVMKGRADFSRDQLFALLEALGAAEDLRDYALLLLDWQRCAHASRKKLLRARLDEIRADRLATKKALSAEAARVQTLDDARYYLDPYVQIVHVCLGIPRHSASVSGLAATLGLSLDHLRRILQTLAQLGLVESKGHGRYLRTNRHRHLDDESPLCKPHQSALKLACLDRLQRLERTQYRSVNVTFSANAETRAQIEEEFVAFLARCQELVRKAPSEEAFQLNYEFFPWSLDAN